MKSKVKNTSVKLAAHVREAVERASRGGGGAEVCGFVMQDQKGEQRFCRVRNISPDKRAFVLDELDFERVLRRGAEVGLKPLAFLHTHTTDAELSEADREGQSAINLPWVILVVPQG